MGDIILKEIYVVPFPFPYKAPFSIEPYAIPESEPLVFDLFKTPRKIERIINNTSRKYYVRLLTDEYYININPNGIYNLVLENDYNHYTTTFSDQHFIGVKSNIFTRAIARKTIHGLKYNEIILHNSAFTKIDEDDEDKNYVTDGEQLVDEFYSDFSQYSSDKLEQLNKQDIVNTLHNYIKRILEDFLTSEQECTNEINDKKKEISKCEEKNKQLQQSTKTKPDPKSSNIWWTILYLIIILNVTYLIFGSIPYIVVTLVIGTLMLEMQYGDGFSRVFMYIFYLLLPTMITLFIIKSVFGISGSPDENNPYNRRYNLL